MNERGHSTDVLSVVGREREMARLDYFVRDAPSGTSIVLIGEPGIGKTTLWEAAVSAASDIGARVLAARPGVSAAQLPFAGLIDLCDQIGWRLPPISLCAGTRCGRWRVR